MTENTQLTPASGYNVSRMIFSKPQTGTIPNSTPQITFKRITISTRNEDGTVGSLILPTSKVFSFGISENNEQSSGKVNGYVLPLCLWNKEGASKEEKEWSDTFNNIINKCKEHLLNNKKAIEKYDLEERDLKKLNPLYWKKDKGKIVPGFGPTLYCKLITNKKLDIITNFYNMETGEELNVSTLLGKYCYVVAAVKIESIFIGGGDRISLQVKVYEADVQLLDRKYKRLLQKPRVEEKKEVETEESFNPLNEPDEEEDDDLGSLNASEEEESDKEEEEKPVKKKVLARRRKVVKPKK